MTLPVVVTGQIMSAANWNAWVVDNVNFLLDRVNSFFPVGSIFISVSPTNPGTIPGFVGTWVAFGEGKALVGIDVGQTEFDTVEETGGAKTHTLSTAELPAHDHPFSQYNTSSINVIGGVSIMPINTTYSTNTASAGGGGAHNNLQPYIVVYMWKRTA